VLKAVGILDVSAQLFEIALGVEEPIFIERIEFDKQCGELHIHMNFRRGGKFSCPSCGATECPVHDTTEKTWRHLNFFQYKCYIHFRTPSTKCDDCGVHLFVPFWGRPQSGFTVLFEALIMTLAREMPVSEIAKLVDEHDTRLWRIINFHIKKAYSEKDFSAVSKVGIDETSSRKGHKYVSVFVDMEQKEVIFATPGKDESTITRFADELPNHNGSPTAIREVSMDMSPAFIKGARKNLAKANITFDKFHVIKQLNEAIDEIRRQETKINPCLKGSRYVWLKNPENLTARQQVDLQTLSKENRKLAKAYQMKLTFQDIYRTVWDVNVADIAIRKWLSWAVRSRLEPIKQIEKMIKSHYAGILQFFKSKLTAGLTEGINSRIQEIKRRAKGFRNIHNFISMIYLEAANLDLACIT
jgi:transposase